MSTDTHPDTTAHLLPSAYACICSVYFPLVKKEGKLKSFPYYVDTSAAFAVVPSNKELSNAQKR